MAVYRKAVAEIILFNQEELFMNNSIGYCSEVKYIQPPPDLSTTRYKCTKVDRGEAIEHLEMGYYKWDCHAVSPGISPHYDIVGKEITSG